MAKTFSKFSKTFQRSENLPYTERLNQSKIYSLTSIESATASGGTHFFQSQRPFKMRRISLRQKIQDSLKF